MRRKTSILLFMAASLLQACVSEAPVLQGQLTVDVSRYATVEATLDEILIPEGYVRRGAPGLKGLADRKVFFASYEAPTGQHHVLVTDIKGQGVLEFQFFGDIGGRAGLSPKLTERVLVALRSFGPVTLENPQEKENMPVKR